MNLGLSPRKYRSPFGSHSRATDGCIVTFDRDGERFSKHFCEVIHDRAQLIPGKRLKLRSGGHYVKQAIDYADKYGAKIVCISSPDTILRDLQGTRASLTEHRTGKAGKGIQQAPPNVVETPEKHMLGQHGRKDLIWVKP